MKKPKRLFFVLLSVSLLVGSLYAEAWAQEKSDEYNATDLFIARPLGVVAAAGGTVLFVLSLPFTLPTRSVEDSFNIFVVDPWKFSFVREFPEQSYY